MVFSLLLSYSWFIIITYISNGSLLAGVSLIKKMKGSRLRKLLLTPIDFNRKFTDDQLIIGDHKPVAGIMITAFWSVLFSLIYHETFAYFLPFAVFLGDIAGSFLKRRLRIKHGRPLFIVDQINFFAAGYLIVLYLGIAFPLIDFLQLAVITIFVHIGTNAFAYKIGIKDEPW